MRNAFKVLVITIILLFVQAEGVQAAEIVESGMCGENVSWTLDSEGTVIISGEGEMYDYAVWQQQFHEQEEQSPFFQKSVSTIIIKEGVTRIGNNIFSMCAISEEVSIPSSVKVIGINAFDQVDVLSKIIIPEGVATIERGAFYGCELEEVILPDSLTSIGTSAFMMCFNLKKINIPVNITTLSDYMFAQCTSLTYIEIPFGVTTIGTGVFCETKIEQIKLPSSVTSIGACAYQGCNNLKEVVIPAYVKYVDSCAFGECDTLETVVFLYGVECLNGDVFWRCPKLQAVVIPDSVTNIIWGGMFVESDNAYIVCNEGSYVEDFAREHNIRYMTASGNLDVAYNKVGVTVDTAKTNNTVSSNPNHILSEAIYTETLPLSLIGGKPIVISTNMVKKYKTITLDYVLSIINSKEITINCAVIGDAATVKEYVLYKGDRKLASSGTGEITVTLGESCIGQDYYVEVVSTKGERTKTALQLNVASSMEAKSGEMKLGGDSIELTFPDDVPFFGGAKIELDSALFPVYAMQTSDGAIRVGINLKKDMLKDDSKFYDFKKSWENLYSDIRKAGGYLQRDLSTLKNVIDRPDHKWDFGPNKINLTIAGYGEGKIDEETGNLLTTLDFMVSVSGNHKWAKQLFFFEVPIVVTAELGFKGGLEEKITVEWGDELSLKEGDVALDFSGEISVFGGVGIKFIAAVGAFGSGELSGEIVWLSTEREPGLDKLDLTLEAGIKGYVGPLKGEIVLANKTWNLYSRPEAQTFSLRTISDVVDEQLTYASMYSASTYQLSGDNYSTTFTAEEGAVGNIISDAFISAQPMVADTDDYVVMTYLTMDSTRPAVDSTVLMYTVYDKAQGSWLEPQKVDADDTMDWTHSLYSDGENIRLVYVQQDSVLSEDIGINDLTTGMKITTAIFDTESMGFVNFEDVAKSNETVYVSRPAVSEVDNAQVICWIQGSTDDYFGMNSENSIYYSSLTDEGWSDAVMLAENLNCVTELVAGSFGEGLVVACVTDGDNNLDTFDDRIVTLIEGAEAAEVVTGDVGNILFDVLPGRTETALLWYEGGNIGIHTEGAAENEYLFAVDEEGELCNSVGADFGIIGDKILFSKAEESGDSSIYSISYDDGEFTMPIPVVSTAGSITTFSADGDMAVWVDTEATVLEDSIDDYSVIGYCMYNEQYDVAALYTEFDYDVLEQGKDISVTVGVQNNTDTELTGVDVLVLDANEDIFFEATAECSIASGTSGEVAITFNAPSSFESAEYKVLVTGQKTDTVPENNYAELSFGLTELSVSARETIYEEKGYFVVDVVNESYVATGGTVTISDKDGNVLHTEVIEDIISQGTYSIVVEAEKLLLEADKKAIIVRIEADKEEYDTLNNTVTENVVVLSGEIPYVTVVFMDDEEELSNTVYPVGATIVPAELPDGMAGWYALGDESKTIVTEFDNISTDMVYMAMANDEDERLNNISFKHNCSFGNNFTLVYAIKQSDLEGFENIRLLVEKDKYEGDTLTETSTKELEWTSYTIDEEDYYRFDYADIKSCEIGDEVRAVLIAEMDGVEYRSTADVYNLKDYAYNRLVASDKEEFKILLVDMLNYCAASQDYFNYREDCFVNAALTEEQKALSSGSYALLNNNESVTELEGKTVSKILRNVSFGNRIEAVFAMDLSSYSNLNGITLHVEYTNLQGVEKALDIDSSAFTYDSGIGMYYGKVSSLSAAELRKVMTVTVMHNGVPISDTITYSIETYVYKKLEASPDEVFKALLEDMMIYADSAQAYFE